MPDFETDMHFLFPSDKLSTSDDTNKYWYISEKTKRDNIYNFSEYNEDYSEGNMLWK